MRELLDFHSRHRAAATMAVRQHEWQHPFGVVRTKGVDILGFEEKPVTRSHINAGIYVLEPDALDALMPGEPCDMPTLFGRLQERAGAHHCLSDARALAGCRPRRRSANGRKKSTLNSNH